MGMHMDKPIQVTFHNLQHSDAVEQDVRARVAKLESMSERMTACRVVIASPNRNQGGAKGFDVKIEMSFPGNTLVVDKEPASELQVAIAAAFDTAKRRIKDHREKMKAG